jgi:hypothetical protein
MAAEGSADGIKIGPDLVEEPEPFACIALVHESTHALPGAEKTLDLMYMDMPGFLEAEDAVKLRNAAHFEEVARQYFGVRTDGKVQKLGFCDRVFTPGVRVMSLASELLSIAWVEAHRLAGMVEALNRAGVKGLIRGEVDKEFLKRTDTMYRATIRLSRLFGLTMHKHTKETKQFSAVTWPKLDEWHDEGYDVDVVEAHARTARLSKYMMVIEQYKAEVEQAVGNTGTAKERVRNALKAVINKGGPIRKDPTKPANDPDKTVLMIEALAELYLHSEAQFATQAGTGKRLFDFARDEILSAKTTEGLMQELSDRLYDKILPKESQTYAQL